ncbi:hypothetical protein GCM10011492_04260 [Flexivirga endophytica]|uniref:Uncharacterized protein n=1 Tax=Flexivirga endophytica TaxID=1849103 RepID=A0A916WNH2_9MICO|nr:hypothetical protein [Flexivirga endophytica]GGB17574.1 hypothetical protein GCM10011492_04260 [Flexivirga endophytica]GHB38063.1 hypothetical protein GCM10008112_03350 [Flexivirga endophytica]
MGRPDGFNYVRQGNEVLITHHGRRATTLRGRRALDFLEDVEMGDPQELMARLTGNYRHGNERQGRRKR